MSLLLGLSFGFRGQRAGIAMQASGAGGLGVRVNFESWLHVSQGLRIHESCG